jgi:hypothetical protein
MEKTYPNWPNFEKKSQIIRNLTFPLKGVPKIIQNIDMISFRRLPVI